MIDSGAGASVFSDGDMFSDLHAPDKCMSVTFGNQKTISVSAMGTVALAVVDPASGVTKGVVLHDVL